jgi:hypothetical protein
MGLICVAIKKMFDDLAFRIWKGKILFTLKGKTNPEHIA